ncbi:MAG: ABC transporter substrate-binding protein [Promethearchaeota archaeon]
MKKTSKMRFISLAILSSLLLTLVPVIPVKAQPTMEIFTAAACGPQDSYYWGMENYQACSADYYRYNALESIYIWPYETPNGSLENLIPVLASDWDFHYRDNEMTDAGFMAYNGIDYINITLRENVTFHDGSNWNATVFKWNIDRLFYILGDIDDCLPPVPPYYDPDIYNVELQRPIYWMDMADWAPYATNSWNVSKLTPGKYANYPISSDPTYNGVEGSRFPRFNNVTILDDQPSGGTVRVYFNDWRTGPNYLANFLMISMEAYGDWFNQSIRGYGNDAEFPQDNPSLFPGHLIGTGPYVFEGHDFVDGDGTMTRFDNWWNASAQQARGWHTIPEVALRIFPHGSLGYSDRASAIVEGDIDYLTDRVWEPIPNYASVAGAPGVNYVDMGLEPYGERIVLNCVNETYLKYWYDINMNVTALDMPITIVNDFGYTNETLKEVGGVDRALRKAISFAFNYDYYITYEKQDRAVRSGGILGKTHEYYDSSVPLAYRNLTIARQTLLDDPFWGLICADRGLNESSTDANWTYVASTNPIYVLDHHRDSAHLPAFYTLYNSLPDIGCVVSTSPANNHYSVYLDIVFFGTYPLLSADSFAVSSYMPRINALGYVEAYQRSPPIEERAPLSNPSYGVISDYPYDDPTGPYNYSLIPGTTYDDKYPSNLGFNYNETCNDIIAQLWFTNTTGTIEKYKELAEWSQDFQYPAIYCSNEKTGFAIRDEWEAQWNSALFMFSFNFVKQAEDLGQPEIIPGYELGTFLSLTLFAGIAFIILRRRNIAVK